MFFAIFGSNGARVERANMDGSNRNTIVSEKIVNPVGLTLDLANKVVYWIGACIF